MAVSGQASAGRGGVPALGADGLAYRLLLVLLCAAYLQGGLVKLFDFPGVVEEMERFGLSPAPLMAAAVIVLELGASAMVVGGWFRWAGSIALALFTLVATCLALRFWDLPPGQARSLAMNGFFEHLGLAGGLLLVALQDLKRTGPKS